MSTHYVVKSDDASYYVAKEDDVGAAYKTARKLEDAGYPKLGVLTKAQFYWANNTWWTTMTVEDVIRLWNEYRSTMAEKYVNQ